jgi:ribose transport system permease protein
MSSAPAPQWTAQAPSAYLLVPILLLFVLLVAAVLRGPNLISSAGIGSAVLVTAPLVLATYALMVTTLAGRGTVDLAIGPLLGFINVLLVKLNELDAVQSPIAVFAFAIAVGVAYQVLMAVIVIFVRVQPIIVALSGYLALSGINLVILPRPGGSAPEWMVPWGAGTEIVSPVAIILVLCTAAWLLFTRTAFHGHLKLMGSDERAAYTAGVRIGWVRLGAHVISGVFVGLAAICYTALIGSGDPAQGTTYTLIAVTALVLGGASLAGGRGGAIGSLLGAVNLFLIGYVLSTFSFGGIQGFVTDLAYGVILVLSLLLTVALPYLQRWLRSLSAFLVFVVLAIGFTGVMLHAKFDYGHLRGAPAAAAAAAPQAAAAGQLVPPTGAPAEAFVFEQTLQGREVPLSPLQRIAGLAALLVTLALLFARTSVAQTEAGRVTPLLYVAFAVVILLGAWVLARDMGQRTGTPIWPVQAPPPGAGAQR